MWISTVYIFVAWRKWPLRNPDSILLYLLYYCPITENASALEVNIRVLLIRNSSRHSSLNVHCLELPFLATLCLYETKVTRVVHSCAVNAMRNMLNVTSSKMWNDSFLYDRNSTLYYYYHYYYYITSTRILISKTDALWDMWKWSYSCLK